MCRGMLVRQHIAESLIAMSEDLIAMKELGRLPWRMSRLHSWVGNCL